MYFQFLSWIGIRGRRCRGKGHEGEEEKGDDAPHLLGLTGSQLSTSLITYTNVLAYKSGTDGRCYIFVQQTLRFH